MALTLEQQQQQLYKLNAELADLKKQQSRLTNVTKGGLLKKFDPKSTAGIQVLNELKDVSDTVKSKQKEYDDLKKIFDAAKADTKVVSEAGSAEEARKAALAGYAPDQIEQYRTDLAKQLADKKAKKQAEDNVKQGEVQSQELTNELAAAGQFIAKRLDDQGRADLAAQLNAVYGTNLPLNGKYSPDLKAAYTKMLTDRFVRSLDEGRNISVQEFLTIGTKEGTYKKGAGEPDIFASISDPTQAASTITSVFKSELNRVPTADELTKYTKLLQSAERRNPFKTVNGIRTGGLDKAQFIVGELQKLPEFIQKKTDKTALTGQSISNTARANGVDLNQDQINFFAKRVQDGEDIKIINNEIRNIAGLGMPDNVKKLLGQGIDLDTIYSPYKSAMATVLEINPATIALSDPTLRGAIGPDKEMSLYEFQKTLRKDPRWQYTNNARENVFQSVNKVLQDFGFQG